MSKGILAEIAAAPNVSIACANLACYVAMTAAFFATVGSKQYDMTVLDKAEYARLYASYASKETRAMICDQRRKMLDSIKAKADDQKTRREKANTELLRKRIGPVVMLFTVLAVFFFFKSNKPNVGPVSSQWTTSHSTLLGLVLLCFSTELFVFGGVLLPYEKIGDTEIAHQIAFFD